MVCNRVLCLICAVRIVRASRRRRVQEAIFDSREADVAKRAIVEVDRHVARTGTYAPAEPVKHFSNQVCHSRSLRSPARDRVCVLPGLDLGRRGRRVVKILAIQAHGRVAIADRRCPLQRPARSWRSPRAGQFPVCLSRWRQLVRRTPDPELLLGGATMKMRAGWSSASRNMCRRFTEEAGD
jgi:hypothetical protein